MVLAGGLHGNKQVGWRQVLHRPGRGRSGPSGSVDRSPLPRQLTEVGGENFAPRSVRFYVASSRRGLPLSEVETRERRVQQHIVVGMRDDQQKKHEQQTGSREDPR